MKALTLGASFGASNSEGSIDEGNLKSGGASFNVAGSSISYNTEPFMPTIQTPFVSEYSSFSLDAGGAIGPLFISGGGTGYQNKRYVKTPVTQKPGYGFLYADNGENNPDAVMDFIREKDNPIIPEIPNIALPIPTPDIWSFTSQAGGGQFRLYRGGSGAFFDNQATDESRTSTAGADIGIGSWAHGGVTKFDQNAYTSTRKWVKNNDYLPNGDFQKADINSPKKQQVYFRVVGEKGLEDQAVNSLFGNERPVAVNITGMNTTSALRNKGNYWGTPATMAKLEKNARRANQTMISYLNAGESTIEGLDKSLYYYYYPFLDESGFTVSAKPNPSRFAARVDTTRMIYHISELTVHDAGGKRMVYGMPVYNTSQDEYSFAIGRSARDGNNLVTVPNLSTYSSNTLGNDNYYHKERKPPYATSYLLTAILSPDYVDKTGDGISDDDLGTTIKFNYSKIDSNYRWRTPYSKAMPNKCLNADPDDDKGSIVTGQKELVYIQSIETKTKIAYFITENRRDGLGVLNGLNGGRDTVNTQKCLREIRLYSKADMTRPIKVVKFKYTYELCRGIPNSSDLGNPSSAKGGKLTLSRVWFEYGNADKGKYHAYVFDYNKTTTKYLSEVGYGYMTTDRWGNYKKAGENGNSLDNEQYPYTNQDTSYTNGNSALWHLKKITLPTGGVINVNYESNDYAYVQDQRAMVMKGLRSFIKSLSDTADNVTLPLNQARGLKINIGQDTIPPAGTDQTAWFKNTFLDGSDYIYTKAYVQMTTNNSIPQGAPYYDMVPTYCQVSSVLVKQGVAYVMLAPITESGVTTNPISISAWQRLKNEYPRYAYPGYDNRVQTASNSISAAVSAVVSAVKNMTELSENFYQRSNRKGYASNVQTAKSFVRITNISGHKLGGGSRVKKISISDSWVLNNATDTAAVYGQAYDYTTVVGGKRISSGVATYEPAIGNDENPLKQPVPYIQKIKGAINNYFDIEKPFGESLYPAPAIGYSKVTVRDLDATHVASEKTGYTVDEFYTAKDFPVKVTVLPLIPYPKTPSRYYSLTRTSTDEQLCLSQGYSIEVNDMHGKPKSNTVYNQSGAIISSAEYYYSATDNGGVMSLNNKLPVVDNNTMLVTNQVLGRDIDFFTDVREQETANNGQAINLGFDVFPIPPWLPWFVLPHLPVNDNNEHKLFRSISAVKVVQSYGIMSKVVKMQNGSTVTTENLVYDGLTGEPVVTRTQNEFKRNIYSTTIPAYWIYKRMGPAYNNLGMLLNGVATNSQGELTNYTDVLQAGDELFDIQGNTRYWVIENIANGGSTATKKLITRAGAIKASFTSTGLSRILRSGYRNMLGAAASSIVSLASPLTADNHLNLLSNADITSLKVINASASTYDESWGAGNICAGSVQRTWAEDQGHDYAIKAGADSNSTQGRYCDSGAIIRTTAVDSVKKMDAVWTGALYRCGIWIGDWRSDDSHPPQPPSYTENYQDSTFVGLDYCLNLSTAGNFLGFAGDNDIKVWVDGVPIGSTKDYLRWHVVPVSLTTGAHRLHIEMNNYAGPATAGVEIYNSPDGMMTTGQFTTLFRTNQLINSATQTFIPETDGSVSYRYRYTDDNSPYYACDATQYVPAPVVVNPYVLGFLGNWRPFETKVFQTSRTYSFAANLNRASVDVKNAGYLSGFKHYWYFNIGTGNWFANSGLSNWVTANTVTLYDKYGQQLENKDALGRYSAARFDFNGELPSAVASNAMNREIYAESMEDSQFSLGSVGSTDTCFNRDFIGISNGAKLVQNATSQVAHSGNYSAQLPVSGIRLSTIVHATAQKTMSYLLVDNLNQYVTRSVTGLYPNGFEPFTGKTYLFNAWVNDGLPNDKSINITLAVNNQAVPLSCKAVVEGWKLIEGVIDLRTLGSSALTVSITPIGTTYTKYIDDIRIHPFDAHMKTYAYDDKTMRLMAELDENCFATFYEYDDEGLLIRVKKETEKGIMTLKESRSAYKRNQNL
jgi:hypothetical protein